MASPRPPRPLGLTLAILASVVLYALLPLLQVAMVLLVQMRLQTMQLTLSGESGDITPLAVGGDFIGVSIGGLIVQSALALIFLVIAVYAWRGRPIWIRGAMIAAMLGLLGFTVVATVPALLATPSLETGLDSGEPLRQSLHWGKLLLSGLVALYVLWYINRGPARAFYKGYYLPEAGKTATTD